MQFQSDSEDWEGRIEIAKRLMRGELPQLGQLESAEVAAVNDRFLTIRITYAATGSITAVVART